MFIHSVGHSFVWMVMSSTIQKPFVFVGSIFSFVRYQFVLCACACDHAVVLWRKTFSVPVSLTLFPLSLISGSVYLALCWEFFFLSIWDWILYKVISTYQLTFFYEQSSSFIRTICWRYCLSDFTMWVASCLGIKLNFIYQCTWFLWQFYADFCYCSSVV